MSGVNLGVDLVKVRRIRSAIEKHGDAFLARIFTEREKTYCESRPKRKYEHYAGRFAAKEALYKAAAPTTAPIRFKEVEIDCLPGGAPRLIVPEEERKRLGIKQAAAFSVSITHDTDYAMAAVAIS